MQKYDFFIAGSWKAKPEILKVIQAIEALGKTAYCFVNVDYTADPDTTAEHLTGLEQDNPRVQHVFETDMNAERSAGSFIIVFPAGTAAHVEAGVAYGMGKKCYAIGQPERTVSLYGIFDEMFADVDSFKAWLNERG